MSIYVCTGIRGEDPTIVWFGFYLHVRILEQKTTLVLVFYTKANNAIFLTLGN